MTQVHATLQGLTEAEAATRLRQDGFNELPTAKPRNLLAIALDVVKEPMFLLLLACGVIYLIAGDVEEALLLLGFVFVVMSITFYQERKTERALEALRDLSSPRALVVRDGQKRRIAGREVVRGDVMLLAEGDRVPADAMLLDAVNLTVDESLLTGESVPVRKSAPAAQPAGGPAPAEAMARPGGDDTPFVYSGTLVVQGQGIAEVKGTGANTEIGLIGKALKELETDRTPLQRETAALVRTFGIIGVSLCVLVVIVFGLTRHDWLGGFLAGLSLAMAMLPEEFPVVLTIFLALGAWRISKHRVLTRRVPAVETLGSATCLCVDKTGTLTLNRMTVSDLVAGDQVMEAPRQAGAVLPETFHRVVEYSILASPADPFDPMEKAMKSLGENTLSHTEHLHHDWELLREYPLSRELLAMSRVWHSTRDAAHHVIAAKGAPEAIADLCHFTPEQAAALAKQIAALADRGRRVIGVASAHFTAAAGALPGQQHDYDFQFEGLLGLEDPVRPGVTEAVAECYTAGIRTIMITGDYPGTAKNIARTIGLRNAEAVITGSELAAMPEETLRQHIATVNVFARMVPEQKLRLVQALKANGEVVAMTGDGVNDAPALKAAHIGIAMGGRGTDVAREAASLVLLDDDFGSIVRAVAMGRRIFDNLKKAMMYIFSVHVPIAGMALLPVLFQWPVVLFPVHIVFLELIIDPACSVVFEAEEAEADVMRRPPRRLGEALFGRQAIIKSLVQGLLVLFATVGVFVWAMKTDHDDPTARALAFTTLVIGNLGLILTNRSRCSILASLRIPNRALWWVLGGTTLLLGTVLLVPFCHNLFKFTVISTGDLAAAIGASVGVVAIMELMKLLPGRGRRQPNRELDE
jgi:Ca2+-transporting ATPase